jgi:hypothetical protein
VAQPGEQDPPDADLQQGDNLQYMQHRLRRLWDDPARGRVPLNWSVNPLVWEIAQTILSYYLRTRTANDTLIAGPSGAGYMSPDLWPAAALPAFLRQSATFMRHAGIETGWIYNRRKGESQPLSPTTARAYAEVMPGGILLNYEPHSQVSLLEGRLPQAVTWGVNNPEDVSRALLSAALEWDGQRPLFLSLGLLAWTFTPTAIVSLMRDLPPEYRLVGASDLPPRHDGARARAPSHLHRLRSGGWHGAKRVPMNSDFERHVLLVPGSFGMTGWRSSQRIISRFRDIKHRCSRRPIRMPVSTRP